MLNNLFFFIINIYFKYYIKRSPTNNIITNIIILFVLNIYPYIFIYIWVSCFLFMMLLNISKPIYVYKYTSNKIYLKYIWIALFFLIIDNILGLYALITYKKVTLFFKGPRTF